MLNHLNDPLNLFAQVARSDGPRPGFQSQRDNWATSGGGDRSAARLMLPRVLGTSGGQGRPQQDGGRSRARRNEPRESPPNKSISRALWVGHEPEPVQRFEGAEKS